MKIEVKTHITCCKNIQLKYAYNEICQIKILLAIPQKAYNLQLKMCTQPHYLQIKQILIKDHDHEQFINRLKSSPINANRYYLGLLLMTLVSLPVPKIQYILTLIKYGADINFTEPILDQSQLKFQKQSNEFTDIGRSVLMIACQKSVAQNVIYLLSYENLQVGYLDAFGRSALYYALCNKNEDQAVVIIRNILKQFPHLIQFNQNSKQLTKSNSYNILFLALSMNKPKILQFLLQNYINCNRQFQPFGMTALHYAISLSGQLSDSILRSLIILLLKFKADPKIQDHLSQTCFDYAQKYLLDLQQIINEKYQKEDMQQILNGNIKSNKCFSLNTYADSRTAFSKDQSSINEYEIDDQIFNQRKMQQNMDFDSIQGQITSQVIDELSISQSSQEYYQFSQQQNQANFHYQLSNQIESFHTQAYNVYCKAYEQIKDLLSHLSKLGKYELELSLQIIGSFATGLWTQHSDIDLAFINQKSGYINISHKLQKAYRSLRRCQEKLGIIEIYFNSQAKFPNIKLRLNQYYGYRRIQIVIFQKKCTARRYVQFIGECIQAYPLIPPLYFILHKILQTFQLHRPTQSGIKSYTLFLMILTVCQAYCWQKIPLSQAFCKVIEYFVYCHLYIERSVEDHNKNKSKFIFNMIDPLNPSNNTGGKDTDTQKLMKMFRSILYGINIERHQKRNRQDSTVLQYLFQLSKMFQ